MKRALRALSDVRRYRPKDRSGPRWNFTGLMVPGTVAAFQREGTGGFVLTLSATQAKIPYVIDPRFPLFQQPLPSPKKSHLELAQVFGHPELVSSAPPTPKSFTDPVIDDIARKWAEFNSTYRESVSGKFDKYAKRLNEPVAPSDAAGPSYVIPPYTICAGPSDPWWDIAQKLFDRTAHHFGEPNKCVRVVAAKDAVYLGDLLGEASLDRAAIWVSRLDELRTPSSTLQEYAEAIRSQSKSRLFAQYCGFFSVVLSSVGLGGILPRNRLR